MAPFELLALLLLTLYAYYESRSMGLHDTVPPPGPTRANYFGHQILATLKEQLGQSRAEEARPGLIAYRRNEEQRRIFCENGLLRMQVNGGEVVDLHPLGPRGWVDFRLLRPDLLHIELRCEAEPEYPYRAALQVPLLGGNPSAVLPPRENGEPWPVDERFFPP